MLGMPIASRRLLVVGMRAARRPQTQSVLPLAFTFQRLLSGKTYTYDEIKVISGQNSPKELLIDVREPAEFAEGFIPSAINLPVKSSPEALLLSEEEFTDLFGFAKPSQDQEVIMYCKSGVRSSAAVAIAERAGFSKVSEYPGSWNEWSSRLPIPNSENDSSGNSST